MHSLAAVWAGGAARDSPPVPSRVPQPRTVTPALQGHPGFAFAQSHWQPVVRVRLLMRLRLERAKLRQGTDRFALTDALESQPLRTVAGVEPQQPLEGEGAHHHLTPTIESAASAPQQQLHLLPRTTMAHPIEKTSPLQWPMLKRLLPGQRAGARPPESAPPWLAEVRSGPQTDSQSALRRFDRPRNPTPSRRNSRLLQPGECTVQGQTPGPPGGPPDRRPSILAMFHNQPRVASDIGAGIRCTVCRAPASHPLPRESSGTPSEPRPASDLRDLLGTASAHWDHTVASGRLWARLRPGTPP